MAADDIFQVLDDAHRELEALQKGVRTLTAEARHKGCTVQDNGGGTVSVGVLPRSGADATGAGAGRRTPSSARRPVSPSRRTTGSWP